MNEENITNESKKSKKSVNSKVKVIVSSIMAAIVLSVVAIVIVQNYTTQSNVVQTPTVQNDGNSSSFSEESASIEDVANKLSPSVVSIVTKSQSSYGRYSISRETQGAGTGIIVSSNGYILTNKHVVDGASTVSVVLYDGTSYDSAEVIATDPLNDIAFLKIDGADNLTAAELGDSKTLNIGQQVIAIGNALGQYQNSVTSGIISGTNRTITASSSDSSTDTETLTDMIQTDASINSGNSGGPLVNAKGQVIGINTAVDSSAQGIGFAIPIGAAKGMLSEILETGSAKRAYIGVSYVQVTPEVAKEYNLSVNKGAYVYSESGSAVVSGSPAAKAGIKDKDIITKINGVEVGIKGSVASLTAEYRAGDTIKITILRDGEEKELQVQLGSYSE
ncbi:trypsin-like peptidase domain-containing protein [Candidatus Saccharibacteria bacterium]|nr:trypsin-like peptidase domain-containing protein [Candidatus Saccharibacteria bacterium]MBP9489473.1 trypsin-like peptidase domain-containing protein [Candidatus Saccharibacteria bacterium]MBP9552008.1 trypsin-like peptidase domain-containing protein [Candidatus Saccharibacteria bacterium]